MSTKKQPKARKDRGGRYCMVLELEEADKEQLVKLIERYQEQLGPAFKVTRMFAIRQLIRDAMSKPRLPTIRG